MKGLPSYKKSIVHIIRQVEFIYILSVKKEEWESIDCRVFAVLDVKSLKEIHHSPVVYGLS